MTNGNQDGIQIRGSIPAIITPMLEDGSLDLPAFRKLIDWHIEEGTNGLVVVGTSGESATLSVEEHVLMVKTAVEHVAGRIPVIAGSGGNSTTEAIELTEQAKKVGADATLQVVPYYNKPTQEGIYRHFAKIAETVAAAARPLARFGTGHLLFARLDATYEAALDAAAKSLSQRYAMDFRRAAERYAALGNAEQVAARIRDFHAAGARHIVIDLVGPYEERPRQIEAFARDVLPLLADLR